MDASVGIGDDLMGLATLNPSYFIDVKKRFATEITEEEQNHESLCPL